MLLTSVVGIAAQGPACAETLADAIAQAYRSNPTIWSSRYDVRAADEDIVQARSELRPTASFQVTGAYERTIEGRASRAGNPFAPRIVEGNSNQSEIVIEQPLYTGGRATADARIATANVAAARAALRGTEGDLLLGVVQAYSGVRRATAALDVWQTSVVELEKLEKEIEARREAGEITRTDVAQANSQLEVAREQVVAAERDLEGARADYAVLVGHDPGQLAPAPALPHVPRSVDIAFAAAETHSPELAQARHAEAASRAGIVAARSEANPTISLRGSETLSGPALPFHLYNQDRGLTGQIVFSLPLSAGGRVASAIRQAEDRNGSDRFKVEAARRTVMRDVRNAWNQMVSDDRNVDLLKRQHQHAATQLDGMINEYRVGLRSTFDVLYAEQSLRDTEVSLLSAEQDLYVAQATLLRRSGVLDVGTLMTGATLYDPADHLHHVIHKSALPWDGAIAAIDSIGAPSSARSRLDHLQQADTSPEISRAAATIPADAALARTTPVGPSASGGRSGEAAR